MRDTSDEASQLSDEVFKRQRVAASSLGARELQEWIASEDIISSGVQFQLLKSPKVGVLEALASKRGLLPEVRATLANMHNFRISRALIRNKEFSAKELDSLLEKSSDAIACAAASRAELSESQRLFFRRHPNRQVSYSFYMRQDLNENEQVEVFNGRRPGLKAQLVRSLPINSPLLLAELAKGSSVLNGFFCTRPDLTVAQCLSLLDSFPQEARDSMRWNREVLSEEVLDKFFEVDTSRHDRALSHAKMLQERHMLRILQSSDAEAAANIARRADLSNALVSEILKGTYGQSARLAGYSNPLVPQRVLREASKENEQAVLQALALNPNIPRDVAVLLMKSACQKTLFRLASNAAVEIDLDSPACMIYWRSSLPGCTLPAEITECIEKADADAWKALNAAWEGSLRELLGACEMFEAGAL